MYLPKDQLGDAARSIINEKDLTPMEVAEELDVAQSVISEALSGRRDGVAAHIIRVIGGYPVEGPLFYVGVPEETEETEEASNDEFIIA